MEQLVFLCGHTAGMKPGFFGRGKARLKRIEVYSGRCCLSCAKLRLLKYLATFTDAQGHPVNQEYVNRRYAEKIGELEARYPSTENT